MRMKPQFNELRATQLAADFLRLRGGRMSYLKLIKLMYLADRTALLRWGRPITYDSLVSMDKGPVLSRTLNLINEDTAPGEHHVWNEFISEPEHYEVGLVGDCPTDELSLADRQLIREIFDQYGRMGRWELVEEVHKLPEWMDPSGSAIPISYEDILVKEGRTNEQVEEIAEEMNHLAYVQKILG